MNTLTNQQILKIAMEQSAADLCCKPSDFLAEKNVIVHSGKSPEGRKYLELPFFCNLCLLYTSDAADD